MELFYACSLDGSRCRLDAEESAHCIRVLRHRRGDAIDLIDGEGTLLHGRIVDDNPKGAEVAVEERIPRWHAHPYRLTLGICPTKNNDRFEWFIEKAVELGVDTIVPLIGERSERTVYKTERARKIALSATKQSLKAALPLIGEPVRVKDFLQRDGGAPEALRLIAYCFEDEAFPRVSIQEALAGYPGRDIIVLIGPEGDFSPEEAQRAIAQGYRPVHLGPSRLRTETAGVTAAAAVYLTWLARNDSYE